MFESCQGTTRTQIPKGETMSEAKLFTASGFNGGVTVGIRGDSYDEFINLAQQVYGKAAGAIFARDVFDRLLKEFPAAKAAAVADQNIGPVSVVGQIAQPVTAVPAVQQTNVVPLQQPQPVAQPTQSVAALNPPGVANPGPCAHGPRVYRDSMAKGRPWRRWECALEWRKGDQAWNSQRCANVNV